MNILFRVDASERIGMGHVMRCLTLAEELQVKGAGVFFICRELPGNLCGYLEGKGYKVFPLGYPGDHKSNKTKRVTGNSCDNGTIQDGEELFHAGWLGVPWEQDAGEVGQLIQGEFVNKGRQVNWLIVDHYSLDKRWEEKMRPNTEKIMVIDDLADRGHDCDLLLDQNLYGDMETRYDGLVPQGCTKFLGPKYALLRPEFRKARATLRQRDGSVKRILVFFGGSDPSNETAKALEAIKMLNRPDIAVDVVVGISNPHKEQVKGICESMPGTSYYCQVENMAELMAKADLAIGAGGSATWERCCLGLPSIIISIAYNQVKITEGMVAAKAAYSIKKTDRSFTYDFAYIINNIIKHKKGLAKVSSKAIKLVDGNGINIVVGYHILKNG